VTALPEPPHLRAVDRPDRDPLEGDGLALAYAALERVRAEHLLRRLSVRIDDPQLCCQLLAVPRGELPTAVDEHAGWSAEPLLAGPSTDIELAVAVCRTALRVDVPASPMDTVELALRRLEGVEAVAIGVDRDIIRLRVGSSASETLVDDVLGVVKAQLDRTVVIEVTRAEQPAPAAPPAVDHDDLNVVAVRTAPENGELEVHLRVGEVRTVGRSALTRGLVGAADAVLEAWHARPGAPARRVSWARTVETSTDARFAVTVALDVPATATVTYGIGTGTNPVEAAVHATVDALNRVAAGSSL
jgi:hypothetical protein